MNGSGNRRMSEIVFFDVETTAPSPAGRWWLLEFGAILVCPRRLVEVASYATLVRPADPASAVSAASVRCNGITRDAVSGAPPFRDVADAVYDLLNGERPRRAALLPVIGPSRFLSLSYGTAILLSSCIDLLIGKQKQYFVSVSSLLSGSLLRS